MACVSWLLVTIAVFAFSPVVGALGWDASPYEDLSSKDRLLDCMYLCTSMFQAKPSELSSRAQQSNDEDTLLLANLSDDQKIPEPRPPVPEEKIPEPPRLKESRHVYPMEHFRWGKPPVRQHRPVKVYGADGTEDEDSEGSLPQQAGQQLGSADGGGQGGLDLQRADDQDEVQTWGKFVRTLAPLLGPEEKRGGKYQMGHFRWGKPPGKRHRGFVRPERSLLTRLREDMAKDSKERWE